MKVDPGIPLVEINDILLKPLAATSSEFFAGTRLVSLSSSIFVMFIGYIKSFVETQFQGLKHRII